VCPTPPRSLPSSRRGLSLQTCRPLARASLRDWVESRQNGLFSGCKIPYFVSQQGKRFATKAWLLTSLDSNREEESKEFALESFLSVGVCLSKDAQANADMKRTTNGSAGFMHSMSLCQETYETTKSFQQQIMVEIARSFQDAKVHALACQMKAATLGQFKAKLLLDKATPRNFSGQIVSSNLPLDTRRSYRRLQPAYQRQHKRRKTNASASVMAASLCSFRAQQ